MPHIWDGKGTTPNQEDQNQGERGGYQGGQITGGVWALASSIRVQFEKAQKSRNYTAQTASGSGIAQ